MSTLAPEKGFEEVAEGVIVRPMLTIQRATDLYLGDLSRAGRRDRTTRTYGRVLDQLIDTLPVDTDVAEIKPDDVRRFLDKQLRKSRGTQAQVFSIVHGLFKWLVTNEKIKRSPMERMLAPRRLPAESLDVTTLSTDDVRKLLAAARGWTEKLSVALPAYMGCRRHAAAQLRVKDYDQRNRTLRFQEKGGKTIWKPVPDELAVMLDARLAEVAQSRPEDGGVAAHLESGRFATDVRGSRGVPPSASSGPVGFGGSPEAGAEAIRKDAFQAGPDDYLIPNQASSRVPNRDDRVVWKAVKRAADRAGVDAHVHALRAAFAVFYLEANPGDLEALQPLMGHKSLATTQVYMRRLSRETAMDRVRGLSWAE